ncbi:site-specific DNA-methyltransferase [Yinghuangia aomiensis]
MWATAQRSSAAQRRGRYTSGSMAHPAKMLPAIAAHAVAVYTRPGDWVLTRMCGTGTTLVEAAHAGAATPSASNTRTGGHASPARTCPRQAPRGTGLKGRSRSATPAPSRRSSRRGRTACSPSWSPRPVRGIRPRPGHLHTRQRRSRRCASSTGPTATDKANLAHQPLARLLDGFTAILAGCASVLRPGGRVVVTARPWRRGGELIDLPGLVAARAPDAGLEFEERCVALLAGIRRSEARRAPVLLRPAQRPQRPRRRTTPSPHRPRRRPGLQKAENDADGYPDKSP